MLERAKHEADEIVAKAKTDAEAWSSAARRMAEDKIAAEERAAVEQLRAAAADAAAKAAARLIAERHDAGDRRQARRSGDRTPSYRRRARAAYCWCWPPGWLTPSSACSAVSLSVSRLRSPRLTMPHSFSCSSITGKPADLRLAHLVGDVLDIVVDAGADQVVAHQVADQRFRAVAFGDAAHGDVAVGDHADQLVAVGDRDRAGIGAEHERRRFLRASGRD